jgi:DHA1 family bicyclomycin/chloramphenicol resistance-like MFS transporter
MALVMLIISVSPMLAPLAGSGIIALSGWRAIFATLAMAAGLSIGVTLLLQPETLAPGNRVPVRLSALLSGTATLLRDPVFMGLTFVGGFGMASFFVFLASASFVYTGHYGLSPTGFSIAFAANAAGFFAATQIAAGLGEKVRGRTRGRPGRSPASWPSPWRWSRWSGPAFDQFALLVAMLDLRQCLPRPGHPHRHGDGA